MRSCDRASRRKNERQSMSASMRRTHRKVLRASESSRRCPGPTLTLTGNPSVGRWLRPEKPGDYGDRDGGRLAACVLAKVTRSDTMRELKKEELSQVSGAGQPCHKGNNGF